MGHFSFNFTILSGEGVGFQIIQIKSLESSERPGIRQDCDFKYVAGIRSTAFRATILISPTPPEKAIQVFEQLTFAPTIEHSTLSITGEDMVMKLTNAPTHIEMPGCHRMWDGNGPLGPAPRLHTSFHEHGMVLLQIDRGLLYTTNRTGARIWQGLIQGKAPSTIATDLNREYGVPESETRQHTAAFIADLWRSGLLVSVEAAC